jgi:hypothetical protein
MQTDARMAGSFVILVGLSYFTNGVVSTAQSD